MQPIGFIVGMSRSGTNAVATALNDHPELAAFGETGFWGKHYVEKGGDPLTPEEAAQILMKMPGKKGVPLVPPGTTRQNLAPMLIGGALRKLFDPLRIRILDQKKVLTHAELFNSMCEEVATYTGKKFIIEKTPHHVNFIDRIWEQYPVAKIILLTRDPYGFMLSYKHQGDRKESTVRRNFQKLYHPIGCSLVYRGYCRSVAALLRRNSSQVYHLAFEQIKDQPDVIMKKLIAFLNVSAMIPTLKQTNSSFPNSQPKELDGADVFWMNLLAGRAAEEIGYHCDRPGNTWAGLQQAILAPLWAFRAVLHLARRNNANPIDYLRRWLR